MEAKTRRPGKYAPHRLTRLAAKGAAESGRKGFILTVVDGPTVGKEYFFSQQATIGRVENNDIVLVEPGISRNHARVYMEHGVYFLEDVASANGTRLNGEPIKEPEVLRDGDYISLSQTTLQFSILDLARGEVTAQSTLSEQEARALDTSGTLLHKRLGLRFRTLLRSRAGKLALAGAALLVVVVTLWLTLRSPTSFILRDTSATPLTYSDDEAFFNSSFGYGHYDQTHRNKVIINFEYRGARATLQYGAWGIDKVGEVQILLNNQRIGTVPVTMTRWVYGLKQSLPRQLLKNGQTNQLVFSHTPNYSGADQWEVCYIQILQEAIPPPDPAEARKAFALAKKGWEDREIEFANMATALNGFKRARDLLEELPERPELYHEAVDYIEKIDKELSRIFSDGMFSARRAEKFDGSPEKARSILLQTQRYFPKDDFRYQELQKYLEVLADR